MAKTPVAKAGRPTKTGAAEGPAYRRERDAAAIIQQIDRQEIRHAAKNRAIGTRKPCANL